MYVLFSIKTHYYIIFFVRSLHSKLLLLILMDPHYGGMCFKSVKSLGTLSQLWKGPLPSASAFSTAKNVELLGSYPIHTLKLSLVRLMYLHISSKLHIGM